MASWTFRTNISPPFLITSTKTYSKTLLSISKQLWSSNKTAYPISNFINFLAIASSPKFPRNFPFAKFTSRFLYQISSSAFRSLRRRPLRRWSFHVTRQKKLLRRRFAQETSSKLPNRPNQTADSGAFLFCTWGVDLCFLSRFRAVGCETAFLQSGGMNRKNAIDIDSICRVFVRIKRCSYVMQQQRSQWVTHWRPSDTWYLCLLI